MREQRGLDAGVGRCCGMGAEQAGHVRGAGEQTRGKCGVREACAGKRGVRGVCAGNCGVRGACARQFGGSGGRVGQRRVVRVIMPGHDWHEMAHFESGVDRGRRR